MNPCDRNFSSWSFLFFFLFIARYLQEEDKTVKPRKACHYYGAKNVGLIVYRFITAGPTQYDLHILLLAKKVS